MAAGRRYTGKLGIVNNDPTAGMIESPAEYASKKLNEEELKIYKKLLEKKNKLALESGKKVIDILAKDEHKKQLDFEKTKKQKREEAHEKRLAELKAEYLVAESNEDKLALKRQINAEKSHKINSEFAGKLAKNIGSTIGGAINNAVSSMDQYIGTYSQYMSAIETRLYGDGSAYSKMANMIKKNVGYSPYVKQTAVLENLSKLVDKGIAYNVEQRAFLATVSDRIATTFDSFDSSLLQIIRLQQSDSTAARLGVESSLTGFLNKRFGDTSYLSDVSHNVSEALLGVESQLGLQRGVEFESTVQRWLGSLYSVGVSSNTLQQIAQGLNYLGTGNVTALSSNEALQRLLVMSAQRAGINYGGMLTGGYDANTANKLLESLVTFGREIAQSENQVVKSQYAEIFGLTISDMTALLNLSTEDLSSIAGNMQTYSEAIAETTNRLSSIGSRMSLKDRIETAFSNVLAGIGERISSNTGLYNTYLAANALISAGDFTIPSISVLGTSTPEIKVGQTAKTGVVVVAGLMDLLGGLTGGNLFGSTDLSKWGASNTRGGNTNYAGYTGIKVSSYDDLSYSNYLGASTDNSLYLNSLLKEEEVNVITGRTQEITDILSDQVVDSLSQIVIALTETGVKVQNSVNEMTNNSTL